jgi:hypothetical protein
VQVTLLAETRELKTSIGGRDNIAKSIGEEIKQRALDQVRT